MFNRNTKISSRIKTPYPALTPAQRFHFETHGYVILEKVFSDEDVESLKEGVYDVFDRYEHSQKKGIVDPTLRGACPQAYSEHVKRLDGMGFAHERLIDFNTHPYLVGMSEEVTGSAVRVNETTAIMNTNRGKVDEFGWHRGADVSASCHQKHNLFHCDFVKTLVNLTDFGPENGGTVCLPGTHKLDIPYPELRGFANDNKHLMHQFIAPKGSIFLFAESLIHATGENRTDDERVLLISSFCNRMLPSWAHYEGVNPIQDDVFMSQFPEHLQLHFRGYADWTRAQRYRKSMTQEVEAVDHALGHWQDRVAEDFEPVRIDVDQC